MASVTRTHARRKASSPAKPSFTRTRKSKPAHAKKQRPGRDRTNRRQEAERRQVQHRRLVLGQLDVAAVEQICQDKGHHWRDGKLTPAKTVECFAWQILMGNKTCDEVRHHENGDFSSPAYCMARQRLPLGVLEELNRQVSRRALALAGMAGKSEHQWKGKSVYRIDGSSASLPDVQEVRRHFGLSNKQKRGCGYPTAHLLVLTGPAGIALDLICSPLRTGDMTHAAQMHRHLNAGDVLLGDGLFGGWAHLWHLQTQNLNGLFPAHHSRKLGWGRVAEHGSSRRFVRSLGYFDQLVEYRKPDQKPKWMTREQFAQAPPWILVREVRRAVWVGGVRRTITVVTTLLDADRYPAKELVKLLGERWVIEVDLRSLKTTMGMERLRCKSIEGVKKELLMYLIVYNLVRMRMLRAAARQKVPLARISFADALASLRYGSGPEIDLKLNPSRPGRSEPRVVKTRPKAYPRMSRSRPQLRRELKAKRKAAFA